MSRYRIEEIRTGCIEGVACGPVSPNMEAEAKLVGDDGSVLYLAVTGTGEFYGAYMAEESILDHTERYFSLINGTPEQEKELKFIRESELFETEGFSSEFQKATQKEKFVGLLRLLYRINVDIPYDQTEKEEKAFAEKLKSYQGLDPDDVDAPEGTFDDGTMPF